MYALNVFYAGPVVNNWSQGLWPHSWSLASPFDAGGGKKLFDYQITNMGARLTLRTFCHENGHMICDYPDLYDYGSDSAGIGNYCLMCYGGNNKNPVQISAYLKNESGWATKAVTITPGITAIIVRSGTTSSISFPRARPSTSSSRTGRRPAGTRSFQMPGWPSGTLTKTAATATSR